MECILDEDDFLCKFDALGVNDHLHRMEKSKYIKYFVNPTHEDDKNIKFFCCTSGVGNAGINSAENLMCDKVGFPDLLVGCYSGTWSRW
eukprot:13995663-Ditylum_brightwellii.AAC.1